MKFSNEVGIESENRDALMIMLHKYTALRTVLPCYSKHLGQKPL